MDGASLPLHIFFNVDAEGIDALSLEGKISKSRKQESHFHLEFIVTTGCWIIWEKVFNLFRDSYRK